jgi:hypothetical protein
MKTVGRAERVSILDLSLFDLDAKVDTGADSNALHCDDIVVDGDKVSFRLLDEVHEAYHNKTFTFPLYKTTRIKSSNGKSEIRPFIKVDVKIFGKKYKTLISLTNRAKMKYPMLIGRNFLSGKFLVDVSKKYLAKEEK